MTAPFPLASDSFPTPGSGDASKAFQKFTLAKKPLTYFENPNDAERPISTLEVRVNGIKWREVRSFFGCRPDEQVYIVRQDIEGNSTITFGDGIIGARLPSGVRNVVARYRFGAGAAKPPPGSITQLVRPIDGLKRVRSPVPAWGGRDAETPEEIRRNAPASALLLGRAVSPQDFEVLARKYNGVINAHVEWAWDERFRPKKDLQSYCAATASGVCCITVKYLITRTISSVLPRCFLTLRHREIKPTCITSTPFSRTLFPNTCAVFRTIGKFIYKKAFTDSGEAISTIAATHKIGGSSTDTHSSTFSAVLCISVQIFTNTIAGGHSVTVQLKINSSSCSVCECVEKLGLKDSNRLIIELDWFKLVNLVPVYPDGKSTASLKNERTINIASISSRQTTASYKISSFRMSDRGGDCDCLSFRNRRRVRRQCHNIETTRISICVGVRVAVAVGVSININVAIYIAVPVTICIDIGVNISSAVAVIVAVAGIQRSEHQYHQCGQEYLSTNSHWLISPLRVSAPTSQFSIERKLIATGEPLVRFAREIFSTSSKPEEMFQISEVTS